MMINLESLKLIDFSSLHILYVAAIYILAIIINKKFTTIKIILSALALVSMIIEPRALYLFILSIINLIQCIMFLRKKHNTTAYRYFLYSFLFVFINIPLLQPYYKTALLCVFLLKAIMSSYNEEINDNFTITLNTVLIGAMVINTNSISVNSPVLSAILFVGITLIILRSILDKNLRSPLSVFPVFVLASALSNPLTTVAILLYAFLAVGLYNKHKKTFSLPFMFIITIPFIDSSIFQTIIQNLVSNVGSSSANYMCWGLVLFSIILALKIWSKHFEEVIDGFTYKHLLYLLIGLVVGMGVNVLQFKITSPIPLIAVVPLLVIDAKYIGIFNRMSLANIYPSLSRLINKMYVFKYDLIRRIYILWILYLKTLNRALPVALKKILIVTKALILKTLIYTKRKLRNFTSYLLNKLGNQISRILGFEELVAIISLIVLILIYILGDK